MLYTILIRNGITTNAHRFVYDVLLYTILIRNGITTVKPNLIKYF